MSSNLTWKHLSLKQIEAYTKLPDPASRLAFLSGTFPVSPDPERGGIELDLYFYVLQFGLQQAFTPDKISVLFSIFKQTHAESMRCDPSRLHPADNLSVLSATYRLGGDKTGNDNSPQRRLRVYPRTIQPGWLTLPAFPRRWRDDVLATQNRPGGNPGAKR